MREAELLAILDAGPIGVEALAALSGSRRRLAQAGIDALIDYLDAVTPDADLEPSLGANEPGCTAGTHWIQSAPGRDLEAVDEDGDVLDRGEHDSSDYEPSLGAPAGSLHHHDMWRHNSLSAFEDEIDWENEEDKREAPTHREAAAAYRENGQPTAAAWCEVQLGRIAA